MNEKGFGRVEVIAFIFVVFISLTISSVLYKKIERDYFKTSSNAHSETVKKKEQSVTLEIQYSSYQELEDEIATNSIAYFRVNSTYDDLEIVSIQTLIQNGYIDTVYAIDDSTVDCIGYVEYNKLSELYTTYLKCGNLYKTNNYDELKEITE